MIRSAALLVLLHYSALPSPGLVVRAGSSSPSLNEPQQQHLRLPVSLQNVTEQEPPQWWWHGSGGVEENITATTSSSSTTTTPAAGVVYEIQNKSHFLYLLNHFNGFLLLLVADDDEDQQPANQQARLLEQEWQVLAAKHADLVERGVVAFAITEAIIAQYSSVAELQTKFENALAAATAASSSSSDTYDNYDSYGNEDDPWEKIALDFDYGMDFVGSPCQIGNYERDFSYTGPTSAWNCGSQYNQDLNATELEDETKWLVQNMEKYITWSMLEEEPVSDVLFDSKTLQQALLLVNNSSLPSTSNATSTGTAIFVRYSTGMGRDRNNHAWELLAQAVQTDPALQNITTVGRINCLVNASEVSYCQNVQHIWAYPTYQLHHIASGKTSQYRYSFRGKDSENPVLVADSMLKFLRQAAGQDTDI